jgi:hypothetical protein
MPKQTELSALRAELKHKLANGTYDPLAERIIKWTRRIFPRLPEGDLAPFLLLILGHFLLLCLFYSWDGVDVLKKWAGLALLGATIFWSGLFMYASLYRQFYRVLSEYVVGALTQSQDLQSLRRWLAFFSHMPLTLFLAACFTVGEASYLIQSLSGVHGEFGMGGLGATISLVLPSGIAMFHLLSLTFFPLILSAYYFDLYEFAPSESPSIQHLSVFIRNSLYQRSAYGAILTLYIFTPEYRFFHWHCFI